MRPHQPVAVDEMVLQRAGHVQQHQRGQREASGRARACSVSASALSTGTQSGSGSTPNQTTGEARRRAVGPADQRHREEQRVQREVRGMGEARAARRASAASAGGRCVSRHSQPQQPTAPGSSRRPTCASCMSFSRAGEIGRSVMYRPNAKLPKIISASSQCSATAARCSDGRGNGGAGHARLCRRVGAATFSGVDPKFQFD